MSNTCGIAAPFSNVAGVVLLLAHGLFAGGSCAPDVQDGAFQCDPEAAEPCPEGYSCVPFGAAHYCYAAWDGDCGNGVLEIGEECDIEAFDGDCAAYQLGQGTPFCTDGCRVSCGTCGNGVMDPGEECDGDTSIDITCESLGYYGGTLSTCLPDCSIDRSPCTGFCGDGVLNASEECDGLAGIEESCIDHGFAGGRLGCDAWCVVSYDRCAADWQQLVDTEYGVVTSVWSADASTVLFGTVMGVAIPPDQLLPAMVGKPTFGLWGTGADDVYAATTEGVFHFGVLDQTATLVLPGEFYGIWGLAADDIYAYGGMDGTHHWDGQSWTVVATLSDVVAIRGWATDDLVAIDSDGQEIWWWDGMTWTSQSFPPGPRPVNDLWGSSADNLYVVGEGLHHFDGQSWTTVPNIPWGQRVWGHGPNDIYVVEDANLWHFDGASWQQETLHNAGPLWGVWGLTGGSTWVYGGHPSATGHSEIFEHFGSRWVAEDTGAATALLSVWGPTADDLYAVGLAGTIVHYDGTQWTPMTSNTTVDLHRVHGNASGDVYVLSAGSMTDPLPTALQLVGGVWTELPSAPAQYWLSDMWVNDVGHAYFAGGTGIRDGDTGVLLRFDGVTWHEEHVVPANPSSGMLLSVFGFGTDEVLVAGPSGIARLDGGSWQTLACNTDVATSGSLWGTAPSAMYYVDSYFDGSACHDLPGTLWAPYSVCGTSSTTVYGLPIVMAGDPEPSPGTFLHFDGTGWSPYHSGTSSSLTSLWAIPNGRVVAVTGEGRLVRQQRPPHAPYDWGDCRRPLDIYCGATLRGNLNLQPNRFDEYPACGAGRPTLSGEVYYRLHNPVRGSVQVNVSMQEADVDLFVFAGDEAGGCDLSHCLASSQADGAQSEATLLESVNTGEIIYFVIDAVGDGPTSYSITLSCEQD